MRSPETVDDQLVFFDDFGSDVVFKDDTTAIGLFEAVNYDFNSGFASVSSNTLTLTVRSVDVPAGTARNDDITVDGKGHKIVDITNVLDGMVKLHVKVTQ